MWMHENNGFHTVKSGYKAIQIRKTQINNIPSTSNKDMQVWKKIWALHTIPIPKMILWRILNNSFPIHSELSKRGVS